MKIIPWCIWGKHPKPYTAYLFPHLSADLIVSVVAVLHCKECHAQIDQLMVANKDGDAWVTFDITTQPWDQNNQDVLHSMQEAEKRLLSLLPWTDWEERVRQKP